MPNGPRRAARKNDLREISADLSSADAEVLRYKARAHSMCVVEVGDLFANLGGTAGVALVPDVWDKGLFFCGGNGYVVDKTMAKPVNKLGIRN